MESLHYPQYAAVQRLQRSRWWVLFFFIVMGKFGGMEDRSSRKDSLILDTCFASVIKDHVWLDRLLRIRLWEQQVHEFVVLGGNMVMLLQTYFY